MVKQTVHPFIFAGYLSLSVFILGCGDDIALETETPQAEQKVDAPSPKVETPTEEPKEEVEEKPKKGIIDQKTTEIVNAKEALEDPNITAPDGKIEGNNPFSQSTSAMFSIRAKVSTLGMQQAVQAHKALNGKPPTLEEFKKIMADHRVEFVKLRRYEMYGYHEDTGNIVILRDEKEYAEHLKRSGVAPSE